MVVDQLEEVLELVLEIDTNNPNGCGYPIVWTAFDMAPASATLPY